MSITITCTCGRSLQVGDEHAGQEGLCPFCGHALRIPRLDGQITDAPPAPPRPRRHAPDQVDDEYQLPVKTHAGATISVHDDFFRPPPPEIGRILSMFTTLKKDDEPFAQSQRLGIGLGCFMVGDLMTTLIIAAGLGGDVELRHLPIFLLFPTLAGLLLAGLAWWFTQFRHACSYVGADGIAEFTCSGTRERIIRAEVFLFEDASELRITQNRDYNNGSFTGTQYHFAWTNRRGAEVHALTGRHKSEEGTPPASDRYHYAVMAESAWSMHLERMTDELLRSAGCLRFGLKGEDHVELSQDRFVLVQGTARVDLPAERIAKMTIGNGVVSIWEKGAKEGWFVNKGIHQFLYADLSNARFFMHAAEKLLGIRF